MSILLSKLLFRLFNLAENNENVDLYSNGEGNLIKFLLNNYKDAFIFFDIGANKGNYSKFVIDKNIKNVVLKGYLFEPLPECYLNLKCIFQNTKFKINNLACSNKTGKVVFYSSESNEHSSLFNWSKGLKKTTVGSIKLQEYLASNGLLKVNLIKIDTEGNDFFVLQGVGKFLNNEQIDFIQFEYGVPNISSKTYLKDFYNLLIKKGFVIGKLFPNYIELRPYSHYMENFHNANYVAISTEFIKKNGWVKDYLKGN